MSRLGRSQLILAREEENKGVREMRKDETWSFEREEGRVGYGA
jgi:hypothetical protein